MRMTHSFPFEQFQCDTRPRRGETRRAVPSRTTVVLSSRGRKPTKRQEQKRRDRACGVRELSPALCVAGISLPRFTCVIRTTAAAASRLSPSPFRCLLPQGHPSFSQRLILARRFDALSMGGTIAVGGVRAHHAAPQHA